jgi:chemotaxis signal transduction protein
VTNPNRAGLFDRPIPSAYRDELQILMASEPPRPTPRTGSMLLFQLGQLRLALPAKVASAVSPVLHIARIPHRSGTVLLGLVAFRGEILPCFSLARLLDITQTATGAARMLILQEPSERLWAVPIDAVLGIRVISVHTSQHAAALAPHWISRSVDDDSGAFYLLDSDNLFRQVILATA